MVTAKLLLDQLQQDQGFLMLLGLLVLVYGGDSADNMVQVVTELLDCKRGDRDMLSWITNLDHLVYRLGNLGVTLDEWLAGTLALLKSGLNRDQRAMVMASTGRSLQLPNILLVIGQLFPEGSPMQRADVLFGAGRIPTKTPTKNGGAPKGGGSKRVTCWHGGERGHVQRDCPKKQKPWDDRATLAAEILCQQNETHMYHRCPA